MKTTSFETDNGHGPWALLTFRFGVDSYVLKWRRMTSRDGYYWALVKEFYLDIVDSGAATSPDDAYSLALASINRLQPCNRA